MGIVATAEFIASYKGTPEEKLWQLVREDEALAELLKDAEPYRPVSEVRSYSANVTHMHGPGWSLPGHAAEFLDPVFSSGVCIALTSAEQIGRASSREEGCPSVMLSAVAA